MMSLVPIALDALSAVRHSPRGVPLGDYLAVVESIKAIVGALPWAAGLAAADIASNVQKLRNRAAATASATGGGDAMFDITIEQLCDEELQTPGWRQLIHPRSLDGTACTSLLWLQRSMRFIVRVLYAVVFGKGTVTEALNAAYDATLRRHHSVILRSTIAMTFHAAPSRESFLSSVSEHPWTGSEALGRLVDEASAFLGEVDGQLIAAGVEARIC
jgi:hypothetical protein